MPRTFRVRGIVEGFYGEPWSHEARRDVISFVAARGMNAYLYAPKDDPKHRKRWREPYDEVEHTRFVDLAAHCDGCGVRFGFAISPGLDIDYGSAADKNALLAKLRPLLDAGITWFLLALDDIPLADGLAVRQAGLATWLLRELRALHSGVALDLCPTEYVGTRPSQYLADLGADLPPDVDVMWTGPTVCSPEITAVQASAWAEALGGRPPLLWDNFPVNDGPMSPALHLGAYLGRDPDLADVTAGVLCNPMAQAHASKVGLATAAEFLADPDAYDAASAWERAIADVGGRHAAPLRALARACESSPLNPPAEMPVALLVGAIEATADPLGRPRALDALDAELRSARDLTTAFQSPGPGGDDAAALEGAYAELTAEVAPWTEAAAREARVGLCAIELLRLIDDAAGQAPNVVAEPLLHSAFVLIVLWGDARGRSDRIVYGPRFAIHPAVVPLRDGSPGLDVRMAVTEDASAIDRLCRAALTAYERWASLGVDQA